jgi:hypothetical protein
MPEKRHDGTSLTGSAIAVAVRLVDKPCQQLGKRQT